jgi:CheY-like chemotaxis protein
MNKLLSERRILVVEDEILILMMIEDMLADLGCKSVSAATKNEQAIALVKEQVFDAAMLDMNLNGKTSHDVADALAARGVPFAVIPGSVYPGMRYITPLALVESGVTQYSQRHILTLVRAKEIPAIHLADKVVLDAFGVQELLDREAASAAENERAGGRRLGPRRPRAHRPARTA